MLETRLKELEALCAAATPGPWKCKGSGYDWEVKNEEEFFIIHSVAGHKAILWSGEDAKLIATARNELPELIAIIRKMKAALEEIVFEGADKPATMPHVIAHETLAEIEGRE